MDLTELLILLGTQVVFFFVVVVTLYRILYAETTKEMKRLKRLNAETAQEQEKLRLKLEQADQDYERRMHAADDEGRKVIAQHTDSAQVEAQTIITQARSDGDKIIKAALKGQDKVRQEIIDELHVRVSDLAEHVMRDVISGNIQRALNQVYLAEVLEDIASLDSEDVTLTQDHGVIYSAMPLGPEVVSQISHAITSKAGQTLHLDEDVEPQIIAGMIIRIGDLEIDASLQGQLEKNARALSSS